MGTVTTWDAKTQSYIHVIDVDENLLMTFPGIDATPFGRVGKCDWQSSQLVRTWPDGGGEISDFQILGSQSPELGYKTQFYTEYNESKFLWNSTPELNPTISCWVTGFVDFAGNPAGISGGGEWLTFTWYPDGPSKDQTDPGYYRYVPDPPFGDPYYVNLTIDNFNGEHHTAYEFVSNHPIWGPAAQPYTSPARYYGFFDVYGLEQVTYHKAVASSYTSDGNARIGNFVSCDTQLVETWTSYDGERSQSRTLYPVIENYHSWIRTDSSCFNWSTTPGQVIADKLISIWETYFHTWPLNSPQQKGGPASCLPTMLNYSDELQERYKYGIYLDNVAQASNFNGSTPPTGIRFSMDQRRTRSFLMNRQAGGRPYVSQPAQSGSTKVSGGLSGTITYDPSTLPTLQNIDGFWNGDPAKIANWQGPGNNSQTAGLPWAFGLYWTHGRPFPITYEGYGVIDGKMEAFKASIAVSESKFDWAAHLFDGTKFSKLTVVSHLVDDVLVPGGRGKPSQGLHRFQAPSYKLGGVAIGGLLIEAIYNPDPPFNVTGYSQTETAGNALGQTYEQGAANPLYLTSFVNVSVEWGGYDLEPNEDVVPYVEYRNVGRDGFGAGANYIYGDPYKYTFAAAPNESPTRPHHWYSIGQDTIYHLWHDKSEPGAPLARGYPSVEWPGYDPYAYTLDATDSTPPTGKTITAYEWEVVGPDSKTYTYTGDLWANDWTSPGAGTYDAKTKITYSGGESEYSDEITFTLPNAGEPFATTITLLEEDTSPVPGITVTVRSVERGIELFSGVTNSSGELAGFSPGGDTITATFFTSGAWTWADTNGASGTGLLATFPMPTAANVVTFERAAVGEMSIDFASKDVYFDNTSVAFDDEG